MRIELGLLGIVVLAGACADDQEIGDWPAWQTAPDTVSWRIVVPDRGTCSDCLSIREVVVIGDNEGPGYHVESHWATRDSLGRYWIRDLEGAKIYGPEGRYVGRVGRSGEGPMEFRSAGATFTDADGNVHLLDPRNARETVVRPDLSLARELRLPWGWVHEAVPLPGEDRRIVNSNVRTPASIGFPLHVVEGIELVSSFGMQQRGSLSLGTMHMLRRIAVDARQRVYGGWYFEYVVDVWNPDGQRLLGVRRPGLWEPPPDGQPQPLSEERNPNGLVLGMRIDDDDRLWMIVWQPRPDWRDNVTEIPLPDGTVTLRPENSNASIYRTVIEVIDLRTGGIVARGEFDEVIEGFLDANELYGNRFTEAGVPRFIVWELETSGL